MKIRMQRGRRQEEVLEFLRHEQVNGQIILNSALVKRMEEHFGIQNAHVYDVVNKLAKKGCFTRVKQPNKGGVLLDFQTNYPSKHDGEISETGVKISEQVAPGVIRKKRVKRIESIPGISGTIYRKICEINEQMKTLRRKKKALLRMFKDLELLKEE